MNFETYRSIFFDEYSLDPKVESERTVSFHRENLKYFEKFLTEERPSLRMDFGNIKSQDVRDYIAHMGKRGLAKATIEGRVKTIKVFSRVLFEAKILPENFAILIHYRVKYRPQIIPFSDLQFQLLLKNIDNQKPIGKRMTAVIKAFSDTGIRLFELNNLDVGDVDFKNREIFIRLGKGRKQRCIPFGIDTSKCLIKYMNAFNIDFMDINAPLFQATGGSRWAKRSIQDALDKLGRKAKIENVRCSPHTFRHFFAINCLKNGVPGSILMKYLGHADMDMVNLYLNITEEISHAAYVSYNDMVLKRRNNGPFTPVGA